jgi:hypothetical protein
MVSVLPAGAGMAARGPRGRSVALRPGATACLEGCQEICAACPEPRKGRHASSPGCKPRVGMTWRSPRKVPSFVDQRLQRMALFQILVRIGNPGLAPRATGMTPLPGAPDMAGRVLARLARLGMLGPDSESWQRGSGTGPWANAQSAPRTESRFPPWRGGSLCSPSRR